MKPKTDTQHDRDLVAERGVLGKDYTQKEVARRFSVLPQPFSPDDVTTMPYEQRRILLMSIEQIRVATSPVLEMYDAVRSSLTASYQQRDPLSPAYVRGLGPHSGTAPRPDADASQLGFAVVGMSGSGKTTTIRSIMQIVAPEQVVAMHDAKPPGAAGKRLSYLFMPSSENGTRSGFTRQFFAGVDELLGTNYSAIPDSKKGKTLESQIIAMKKIVRDHDIGLLIIDDVQQIAKARASAGEGPSVTMAFLLSITNEVGVPIVFIGTERFARLLEEDMQLARRCEGLGRHDMGPLGDHDYDLLLTTLFRYQATDRLTPLTPGIRDAMSSLTKRYPGNVVRLWRQAQQEAINAGDPCVSPQILDATMHKCFSATFAALYEHHFTSESAGSGTNKRPRTQRPDDAAIEAEAVEALLNNVPKFPRSAAVAAVRQAMTLLPMGTDASNVAVRAVRILAEASH